MLINTHLNNLTFYYSQQPILRLIAYLNTQMLPSLDTGSPEKKAKEEIAKESEPEPTPMLLQCSLINVSIFIEPDPLQLYCKEPNPERK